jgi:excisionase family DNA binding protein
MEPMNKQEAAEFLGCSIRQLERYTSENRIGVRYEKGRTRPTPIYDENELTRFKEEQERPIHRPVVEPMEQPSSAPQTIATQGDNTAGVLALLSQPVPVGHLLAVLARAGVLNMPDAVVALPDKSALEPQKAASLELGPKLLLTLPECQKLTGLSREVLRTAIDINELKARQIGRAWRVKRADLEAYIASL